MELSKPGMKRVTVQPKCPNPLFEEWLSEWRQESADKGSDMQYCFGKALKSLRKYPLPLKSGRECIVLECFGNRLCQLLDRKLAEHRKSHPEVDLHNDIEAAKDIFVQPEKPGPSKKRKSPKKKKNVSVGPENEEAESSEPPTKVPRRSGGRKYVPAWRSGPYAILITLLTNEEKADYPGYMLKAELQHEAQPLCDKSFTRPDPGSHYTAWSSMSQIVKKGLVHRFSNPAKFQLTEEGRAMAKLLQSNASGESTETYSSSKDRSTSSNPEPEIESPANSPPKSKPKPKVATRPTATSVRDYNLSSPRKAVTALPFKPSSFSTLSPDRPETSNSCISSVVLERGGFDVLLLVDTCETAGASKKRYDQTLSELTQMKVPFEVRKLEVGDFLWIARSRTLKDELILPYIVERKRMDDLGASIKDRRFKEQKFRLKQSGIQNLIYLVESHGSDQHVGLPLSTLQQAAVNTQVVDGFIVKHTIDHRHSMAYLASLTRILGRAFLNKTLLGCLKKDLTRYTMSDDFITLMTFEEFKHSSKKNRNFTAKEMFIRQLLQMKNLSVEKALAITGRYPTPQALTQAYRVGGGENLLADIPCQGSTATRTVGPAISKSVYLIYNSVKLH